MSESEETISKTALEEMKEAAKGPSTKHKSKDNENKVTTTKDTTNATPSTSVATGPESPKKDASTDPLHDTGIGSYFPCVKLTYVPLSDPGYMKLQH